MMSEINTTNKKYERVLIKYRDIDDEAREVPPSFLLYLSRLLFQPVGLLCNYLAFLRPLPASLFLRPASVPRPPFGLFLTRAFFEHLLTLAS